MFKKGYQAALLLFLAMVVILSGCAGGTKDPKEALSSAAIQTMNMESYVSNNQIKIVDLNITPGDVSSDLTTQMGAAVSLLKNAEINVKSIYQQDPMQSEMQLEVKLAGDVSTTITIPMVMTQDTLYVKIPSVPFLPLPETVIGKFLVLNMQELMEQSGEEFDPELLNPDKSKKLMGEISAAVFSEYDTETYFKNIDPKDANLPEGVSAKQVVQFTITNDKVKEAVEIMINKVLPKILDIMAKEEYSSMLGLTPEEVREAKADLQSGDQAELKEGLDELGSYLTVHQLTMNTAIDKKDYPAYQDAKMDFEFNDPDTNDKVRLALEFNSTFSKINEKQTFEIGIPSDTITMEQLQEELGGLGY